MMGGIPPGPPPGPPMMGGAPGLPPMGPPGMGGPPPGPQFPSLDPSMLAQAGAPIAAIQQQDQQALQQQQDMILSTVLQALKSQPNPAGQAAMSEPGYPTTQQTP